MDVKLLLLYIGGWYISSISISLFNRWIFDPSRDLNIPFPILITGLQQITLWFMASFFIKIRQLKDNRKFEVSSSKMKYYLTYILPIALSTAGDIGCSNTAFKYVPLSVYTIIKSSSIAFVLLFGCIFKVEKFHMKLLLIVIVMFTGVTIMVYDPSQKDAEKSKEYSNLIFGSLLVLIGSCLSGLRWVYTQLVLIKQPKQTNNDMDIPQGTSAQGLSHDDLKDSVIVESDHFVDEEEQLEEVGKQNNSEKPHSVFILRQLAPTMIVLFFTASLIIERPFPRFFHLLVFKFKVVEEESTVFVTSLTSVCRGIVLIIIPGIVVFFLTLCEFGILQIAKVLTLSVAGIVKEVLTIVFSVIVLNEGIEGLHSWVGMSIIMVDVIYYNYFRYTQKLKQSYSKLSENDISSHNANNNLSTHIHSKESLDNEDTGYTKGEEKQVSEYPILSDPVLQEFELNNIFNSSSART